MTEEERIAALNEIAAQIRACTLCALHKGRTKAVPGDGSYAAEIMFIGEGPGYHEDQQGLPFVGQSGNYLSALLKGIGIERKSVFITNVIKCRPPDNRDPLPGEIEACRGYLDRQIELIDPLLVVTLGRFSMARYFPGGKITQIHGKPRYDERRAYYPLFHPAAVLRNASLTSQMDEDFRRIPSILEEVRKRRRSLSGAQEQSAPEDPPVQLSLF